MDDQDNLQRALEALRSLTPDQLTEFEAERRRLADWKNDERLVRWLTEINTFVEERQIQNHVLVLNALRALWPRPETKPKGSKDGYPPFPELRKLAKQHGVKLDITAKRTEFIAALKKKGLLKR